MKIDIYTKIVLTVIAICLLSLVLKVGSFQEQMHKDVTDLTQVDVNITEVDGVRVLTNIPVEINGVSAYTTVPVEIRR